MQPSTMLLNSSSSPSSCMTAIQTPYRPGGRGCQAVATPLSTASQRRCTAGYSACGISLKNLDRSTFRLQREARLTKSSGGGAHCQPGFGKQGKLVGLVVRAETTTGVVKEVRTEVEGLYYNVTLSVSLQCLYTTPGQYVNLLPANSTQRSAAFFVASPLPGPAVGGEISLEFLIQETDTPSVANELINSKIGDSVIIETVASSNGFNFYPVRAAESVLMFASGYGLGPIRAFIETGFEAKQKKDAILYTMYQVGQQPYKERTQIWEESGVTVVPYGSVQIVTTNPTKTAVLLVASEPEQEDLINFFEGKGVPSCHILTLFDGIPPPNKLYINNVHSKPNFLPMGRRHAPVALKY